jgi:aminopeptidase-like protein
MKESFSDACKGMYSLMERLYPICRSITGNGVRETLKIIKEFIPIEVSEVKSGTKVFDWNIPKEWNIRSAFLKGPDGKLILDFSKSNLCVLNYSAPVNKRIELSELREHLFSLPDQPELTPYLTTYYKENWGFCLPHKTLLKLKDGTYEAVIDSELKDGHLTFGELFIKGKSDSEILFSCYICHPSLCNDNLSGVVMLVYLAKYIISLNGNHRYSYRFLFIPETIGAITWLSINEKNLSKIKHGLVATCLGDNGKFTYKKSRNGSNEIDLVVQKVLEDSGVAHSIVDFFPSGSDERQFCSPAFDMPVGSLMRTMYGKFPEYHTSADNLSFVSAKSLWESYTQYLQIISVLEDNMCYRNTNPKCEPQLGRRGLYNLIGGQKGKNIDELSIFWALNLSDGNHSLLQIAIRSGLKFSQIKSASDALASCSLLVPAGV